MNKRKCFAAAVCGGIVFLAVLIFLAFQTSVPLKMNKTVKGCIESVQYEDRQYIYDQDWVNILCLGIDTDKALDEAGVPGSRGQSDTLFLVSVNTRTKAVNVLNIPRDSMAPVSIYDASGEFASMQTMQITLQYAYGSDEEDSCKKTAEAVSALLKDIPIHRYCAINFNAIPALNDAVGGVEVQMNPEHVDEELQKINDVFKPGGVVRLTGEESYYYLRVRDIHEFASCEERAERQKVYVSQYICAVKEQMKADKSLLFDLYSILNRNMTTDVGKLELLSLSSYIKEINFEGSVNSIPGKRIQGEIYEEFYPDDEALTKMIAEIYCIPPDKID